MPLRPADPLLGTAARFGVRALGRALAAGLLVTTALLLPPRLLAQTRATPGSARGATPDSISRGSGWVGISISMRYDIVLAAGAQPQWRFREPPLIEYVEPGSPADRAGLQVGDRILGIDGRDVREGIPPLDVLLRPGRALRLTIARRGALRTVRVRVGTRPVGWPGPLAQFDLPGMLPPRPLPAPLFPPLSAMNEAVLAGAALQRVGELRDYFGVSDGLLVLGVVPGTPAARAGLRGGDVIVRAGHDAVSTPGDLASALAHSRQHALALAIVRRGAPLRITLRWGR